MHWQFLRIPQGIVHKRAPKGANSPYPEAISPDTLATSSEDCTLLDLIAYFAGFGILAVFRQKPMKSALEA